MGPGVDSGIAVVDGGGVDGGVLALLAGLVLALLTFLTLLAGLVLALLAVLALVAVEACWLTEAPPFVCARDFERLPAPWPVSALAAADGIASPRSRARWQESA